MLPPPFGIRVTSEWPFAVLTLAGELDVAAAEQLEQAVAHVRDDGAAGVVVDLSGLSFVDSTGIRVLLSASAALGGDGRFVLACATGQVERVFRLVCLDDLLTLSATRADALQLLRQRTPV